MHAMDYREISSILKDWNLLRKGGSKKSGRVDRPGIMV